MRGYDANDETYHSSPVRCEREKERKGCKGNRNISTKYHTTLETKKNTLDALPLVRALHSVALLT